MVNSLSVETLLKKEGPCLSTRLCEILQQAGVSPEAARQRISRANGSAMRLSGLVFPRGARFIYNKSDFGSESYWTSLLRDIDKASPAYSAAIAALKARGGIVPRSHFDIISGAPLRQKGQISSETVLERLLAVKLVQLVEVDGIGACVRLDAGGHLGEVSNNDFKARLITEKILLLAVKDWARKLGIASYEKICMRDGPGPSPRVGTFAWDLTGPSYLKPMARWVNGKPKPGFLVCDVVLGDPIGEDAVASFVRKCQTLSGLKLSSPLLPVLVATRFSREALYLGRSKGIMMATPDILFGEEVSKGLASLLHTLSKAAEMAVGRPKVIHELFSSLGRIEGAAKNLRGALFEMLVGHCVKKNDDGSIDIGKQVSDPDTGKSADIDVFRVKENREVWSYECKGHQPSEMVRLSAVEHWLTNRVPLIHKNISREKRFQGCEFHYEYWTSGQFEPEAVAFLQDAAKRTKKYLIGWKDGSALRKYAAKVKPKTISLMLDEHFFDHPLK